MRGIEESYLVYIVDDDDAVRDSLAVLLELEGFVTKQFSSAGDFLKHMDKDASSKVGSACMLLDLHMPGMRGQQLLDDLMKDQCDLPIIILTGNADSKTRLRAFASGAAAFLEKPVDVDRLLDTLWAVNR